MTVFDAMAALWRLPLLHYVVDGNTTVTRLRKPDEHRRKILDALKVSLPTRQNEAGQTRADGKPQPSLNQRVSG